MTDTAKQYTDLAQRLAAVADAVEPARWDDPSPCDGWSAADVISHVVETQRDFLAGHDVDLDAAPDVHNDPAKAWREHAGQVGGLLARPEIAEQTFDGFFGPTTVGEAMALFYGFDMIVHRWDVARATGVGTTFSPHELNQVETSVDGFGDHLYAEGICGAAVDIDPDASREDRLLARMGRDPR
jgi:uncharacterized protein (TIGR03086 family)